jgi:endonuclease YncB( thermonuclease family)
MAQAQHSRSRHARGSRAGRGLVAVVAGALVLVLAGGVVGYLVGSSGDRAAATPAAQPAVAASATAAAPPGAVVLGQVTRVASGDEIMVRVGTGEDAVRVLGLDTPSLGTEPGAPTAECGGREALAFADSRLTGQAVTLVPDPAVPDRDERGARLAYVVLRSQLNYTDAALLDGIGRADRSRPLTYAEVFAREQGTAVTAERGIWGEPCNAAP